MSDMEKIDLESIETSNFIEEFIKEDMGPGGGAGRGDQAHPCGSC